MEANQSSTEGTQDVSKAGTTENPTGKNLPAHAVLLDQIMNPDAVNPDPFMQQCAVCTSLRTLAMMKIPDDAIGMVKVVLAEVVEKYGRCSDTGVVMDPLIYSYATMVNDMLGLGIEIPDEVIDFEVPTIGTRVAGDFANPGNIANAIGADEDTVVAVLSCVLSNSQIPASERASITDSVLGHWGTFGPNSGIPNQMVISSMFALNMNHGLGVKLPNEEMPLFRGESSAESNVPETEPSLAVTGTGRPSRTPPQTSSL